MSDTPKVDPPPTIGKTLWFLAKLFGGIALIIWGMVACSELETVSDGEKIGQLTKLSREGIMFTNWESELIRGGLSDGSGAFGSQMFRFTVKPAMAAKVRELMEKKQEVKIVYRTILFAPFSSNSGGTFLVSIEPLGRKP
jgi:hypothetical protein